MLKLETARAKDRVCGDRAKSGTHQLLLMMRACGYCATQAESVERQACYCKRSTHATPLSCTSGFLRLANTGCLQALGWLHRRGQSTVGTVSGSSSVSCCPTQLLQVDALASWTGLI